MCKPCHKTCLTCFDEQEDSCLTCDTTNNFEEDIKGSANLEGTVSCRCKDGYWFDEKEADVTNYCKACDKTCEECAGEGPMKCTSCKEPAFLVKGTGCKG